MGTPHTLLAVALLALPTSGAAAAISTANPPGAWREQQAVAALFREAGVEGTFVLLDERSGELHGHNQSRAEQRFVPA